MWGRRHAVPPRCSTPASCIAATIWNNSVRAGLATIPPFEFENWAVIAVGGIPSKVQVGDMGVDGRNWKEAGMSATTSLTPALSPRRGRNIRRVLENTSGGIGRTVCRIMENMDGKIFSPGRGHR
jgi:hypothetical protein